MHKVVVFLFTLFFAILVSIAFGTVGFFIGWEQYKNCGGSWRDAFCSFRAFNYALAFAYPGLALGSNLGIALSSYKRYKQHMAKIVRSTIWGTFLSAFLFLLLFNLNENSRPLTQPVEIWIVIILLVVSIVMPISGALWGLRNSKLPSSKSIETSLREEGWKD